MGRSAIYYTHTNAPFQVQWHAICDRSYGPASHCSQGALNSRMLSSLAYKPDYRTKPYSTILPKYTCTVFWKLLLTQNADMRLECYKWSLARKALVRLPVCQISSCSYMSVNVTLLNKVKNITDNANLWICSSVLLAFVLCRPFFIMWPRKWDTTWQNQIGPTNAALPVHRIYSVVVLWWSNRGLRAMSFFSSFCWHSLR